MSISKLFSVSTLCCLFMILSFGGIAIWQLSESTKLLLYGEEVEATVLFYDKKKARRSGKLDIYYPVVRYVSDEGIQQRRLHGGSSNKSYKIGEKVSILYDKENPLKVIVNNLWYMYFFPFLGLSIAAFFVWVLVKENQEFDMSDYNREHNPDIPSYLYPRGNRKK